MKKLLKIVVGVIFVWFVISFILALYAAVFQDNVQAQESVTMIVFVFSLAFVVFLIKHLFSSKAYRNLRVAWFSFGAILAAGFTVYMLFIEPEFGLVLLVVWIIFGIFFALYWKKLIRHRDTIRDIKNIMDFLKND